MDSRTEPDPYRDVLTILNQLTANLTRFTNLAHPALAALHRAANQHDSYPTTTSGRDRGPHGNTELTRIEAAAHHRLGQINDETGGRPGPTTEAWDLYDHVACADQALEHAIWIAERNLTIDRLTDSERKALRCIGDDTPEGATCTDYATVDGRCDRHHLAVTQRSRAEQRAQRAGRRALHERLRYHRAHHDP